MKSSKYSQGSIQALLEQLDGTQFVSLLGVTNGDVSEDGSESRVYCTACNDRSKMTFVVDSADRRAYCTNLYCDASRMNSGGGNFIEMYSLSKGVDFDVAARELADGMGFTLEERAGQAEAQELTEEAFRFVEVGHAKPSKEEEGVLVPALVNFADQEGNGRGVYIDVEQLPEFSEQYRHDVYQSHFQFNTNDEQQILTEAERGTLHMLGDFYVVFNASSSAEIVHAINQGIDLVERIKENYDVPYDAVKVFYTSENIEIHVDYTAFGIVPTVGLHEVFRRMTCALIGVDPLKPERSAAFSQIDLGVYRHDYLTNIPGTQLTSGTREIYKIRMKYSAFKKMSYQRLHEFSLRRPDLPPVERWDSTAGKARDFFNSVMTSLMRDTRIDERDTIASLFYRPEEKSRGISTVKQLAPTLLRRLFDENRQVLTTFSKPLNQSFAGGLYPGQLYVLAGFPGSGTSSLALQVMNHVAAEQDSQCLFIGLQRGVEEVFKRSLSYLGRIPANEIDEKRQNPADLYEDKDFNRRIFNAYERYQQFSDNITILEGSAAGSLSNLRDLIVSKKEQVRDRGGRQSGMLVVVDSLQLLVALNRAQWAEQQLSGDRDAAKLANWDVDTLTSRLKALARELDVTVLATFEHHIPHRGLASGLVERDPSYQELLATTQFADAVCVLTRQGANLLNLRDYFTTAYTGTPQEKQIEPLKACIEKIEEGYCSTNEFLALRSEFAVMDIIKNRTGTRDKVLFVYHKPLSYFEPLSFDI